MPCSVTSTHNNTSGFYELLHIITIKDRNTYDSFARRNHHRNHGHDHTANRVVCKSDLRKQTDLPHIETFLKSNVVESIISTERCETCTHTTEWQIINRLGNVLIRSNPRK